ncbi:sporulation protein Cse60 [Streptococcus thermophilus]|nr:sporulation protein Cse60 [Streptococcus thermophilus]
MTIEEVIDIKYQTVAFEERGETIVLSSALIIYKEEE